MSKDAQPTPSELLAAALPDLAAPPADWFTGTVALSRSSPGTARPGERPVRRNAEPARSRPSDRGHAFLPGAAIFSESGGLDFGSRVHEALAEIEWLPAPNAPDCLLAFLSHPEVAALFTRPEAGADVWRERAVACSLGGRLLSAQMDRVIVTAHEIVLVDFKTDQGDPAEIASRYRAQMHDYISILEAWSAGRHAIRAVIATVRHPAVIPVPAP